MAPVFGQPCCAISCHAIACHCLLCHAILGCHATPLLARPLLGNHCLPCYCLLCHCLPCHCLPCHCLPCHASDNSRPSLMQTIADQSILRSAVLPASPMPLFRHQIWPKHYLIIFKQTHNLMWLKQLTQLSATCATNFTTSQYWVERHDDPSKSLMLGKSWINTMTLNNDHW